IKSVAASPLGRVFLETYHRFTGALSLLQSLSQVHQLYSDVRLFAFDLEWENHINIRKGTPTRRSVFQVELSVPKSQGQIQTNVWIHLQFRIGAITWRSSSVITQLI